MSDAHGPADASARRKSRSSSAARSLSTKDYSEDTAIRIDQEIKRIVTTNYDKRGRILETNRPALDKIADELLVREVLDADQVRSVAQGKAARGIQASRPRPAWPDDPRSVRRRSGHRWFRRCRSLNKPLPQE